METTANPKDTVLDFVKALNEEHFEKAKSFLTDNFTFNGPLGTRNGSKVYIEDMAKMKLKYEIEKVFDKDKDVCLIYSIDIMGEKLPTCGLYHLENDKITSLKVLFDPRPVLEK